MREKRDKFDTIKGYISRVGSLIVREDYNKFFSNFVRTLRLSRLPFLKRYPLYVNATQMGMVSSLSKFQGAIKEGKERLRNERDEKQIELLKRGLTINKELVRVWQTIADGIAWRALRFNRPILRLLSENQSPGFIAPEEVPMYNIYLRKAKNVLLINDLTRYLRIGDLTMVSSDGRLWIYEIKESGKKLKDILTILSDMKKHHRWFGKQEIRHFVAQTAIVNHVISVPSVQRNEIKTSVNAEIVNLDFKLKSHLPVIKKMIRIANKKGFYSKLVEDGYYIVVTAFDVLVKNHEAREAWKRNKIPEWISSEKNILRISSYYSFFQGEGHFPRNYTPCSVLPFKARDCVRIMMGHLEISVFYDLDILRKKLEQAGWVVEGGNLKEATAQNSESIRAQEARPQSPLNFMQAPIQEELWFLKRSDESGDVFGQQLILTYIIIVLSAYYQTDVIIQTLKEQYERAKVNKNVRFITINLPGENKVLV